MKRSLAAALPILSVTAFLAAALNSIDAWYLDGKVFYFTLDELFRLGILHKDLENYVTIETNGAIGQDVGSKKYRLKPKYTFEDGKIKEASEAKQLPWKGSYYNSEHFFFTQDGWFYKEEYIHVGNVLGIRDQTYVAKNEPLIFTKFLQSKTMTAQQILESNGDTLPSAIMQSSMFPESLPGLLFVLERVCLFVFIFRE